LSGRGVRIAIARASRPNPSCLVALTLEAVALTAPAPILTLTRIASFTCAVLIGLAMASACAKPRELSAVDRGAVIYRTNCISCHNADPSLPGPIGPAVAGVSRALLDARVLHGTYPPGYTPHFKTHTMRALPWLDGHVDDLDAYLTAVAAHHPTASSSTPPS
jgi:mono/diheme cytochrome c family protein